MITTLKGKIKYKGGDFIILDVNNVGYKVKIQNPNSEFPKNKEVEIFTYLYVRENELSLYGFKTIEELGIFELLLLVSGIGPKGALKILSLTPPKILKEAIFKGDKNILAKTAGISERIAQRIITELKGKISEFEGKEGEIENISEISEAIDALISLGYTRNEALAALEKLPPDIKNAAERVKLALKNLGK